MEQMRFEYSGDNRIEKPVFVGVVGSGDLEILMKPVEEGPSIVEIRTRFEGFENIWRALLDRFFEDNRLLASIKINDFGATPGMVSIRLQQALEEARSV